LLKRVFFHRVGATQKQDKLIYQNQTRYTPYDINLTDDDKYLILTGLDKRRMTYFVKAKALKRKNSSFITIVDKQEFPFTWAGNKGNRLYFISYSSAPLGKLVEVTIHSKYSKRFYVKEIIPQNNSLLYKVFLYPDFIVAYYAGIKGGVLYRTDYDGHELGKTLLPVFTQLVDTGDADKNNKFISIEGYISPEQVFLYRPEKDKISLRQANCPDFEQSQYITEIKWVATKYGIDIPVYLNYKKGLRRNGNNPTILTAYGGFGTQLKPWYRGENIAWMEAGGIFAEAILRGDANLGWEWRVAGHRKNKQNTFNDFISVAEYLIREQYTCPRRLGIYGTSHGGLVAACALVQRPELFGAVAIDSAPLDILRHTQFKFGPIKIEEYGSTNDRKDFKVLYSYSPLHQLRETRYPAVLITVGDNDDTVNPSLSYKFAAALQNHQKGCASILLKVFENKGHSNSAYIAYRFGFLEHELGLLAKKYLKAL
jgi:prolyl oligopeptidase